MNRSNFFDEGSPFLQHPALTDERTRSEIAFILTQLDVPAGGRILDVGCGFGRHSLALARLGFDVTGIDPAAAMIASARERAQKDTISVTFKQILAEQFVAAAPYDAAICLLTTLGQVAGANDNRGLLDAAYRSLKPGGCIVVEVPQRDAALAGLKPSDRFGSEAHYTVVTRAFDAKSAEVSERFLVVTPDQRQDFLLRYRLFSRPELSQLLQAAGFDITGIFGDYAGTPLALESQTMLFIARK